MEVEFDKEIDAILRQARGGEVVTSSSAHLDADEISAFAENAASDTTRARFTAHLADCTRCRKILSNVITLNSEAETEAASSAVPAEIVETNVPWYRKLFAFPQLAYALGALVVLFSAFFGYLILQNLPGAREVSYSANSTTNKSAPQAAPVSASNSNTVANTSTTTTTNSSAPVNANTTTATTNSAPFSAANTNASTTTTTAKKPANTQTDAPLTEAPMATPEPKPMPKDEDDKKLAITRNEVQTNQPSPAGAVRDDNTQAKKENQNRIDGRSADAALSQEKAKTQRSVPENRKQPSKAGETRSVGGKIFNNVGGIWFDSAYGKQKTKNISRGTSEYLKLDAGLRSIADQLGGTVVVVWSGKAYRIQ